MDDSFNIARHVARLVSLLMRQPGNVEQQKLELRTLVLLTKEGTLRLSMREGQLMANGLAVPQVLAGVRDMADQMIAHRVDSVELNQEMAAGELLSISRIIAEAAGEDPSPVHARIKALDAKTVIVQLRAEDAAPEPGTAEYAVATAEPAVGSPERIPFILERANRGGDGAALNPLFEEVAFAVEQATREGKTNVSVNVFTALIAHEHHAADPEVRRQFVLTIRRLTKPHVLNPIARLLLDEPARADSSAAILERCGTDGADAVVDQYSRATTAAERQAFHSAFGRLAAADDSLVAMLSDQRSHMVRTAAELIADRRAAGGAEALAEQLGAGDPRVRRAVVRALGRFDSPFSVDAIARALEDPVVEVRLEAVAALAARKGAKVGDIIGRAIDLEEDIEVQVGMLGALGRVGTPDAVAKLSKAAESGSVFSARKGSGVRVAAVRALAEARTAAAMTTLTALANDKDREVRDAATRAIGR